MTLYRVFVAAAGDFRDSSKYRFIADFADQKTASDYVSFMRGKKRYQKQDIIVKAVPYDGIDSTSGIVEGVISVLGESLPVDEYEFI
ncbi:MAG: hypothetical protein IJ751_01765 [Oscillospiraceae bacterium]|nr:hypothetical protein [Oscillospiraceae bacterium]